MNSSVDEIIDKIFKTRNLSFEGEIDKDFKLKETDFLITNSENNYEVNLYSIVFYEALKEKIERRLDCKISLDIEEAFIMLHDVEEKIKLENGFENIINAYTEIFKEFKVNYLLEVEKKNINVIDFYNKYKIQNTSNYKIRSFVEVFFKYLSRSEKNENEIIELFKQNDNNNRYYFNKYLEEIVENKKVFAEKIINEALKDYNKEISHLVIILTTALVNNDNEKFDLLNEIFKVNVSDGLWAYSLVKIGSNDIYLKLLEIILNTKLDFNSLVSKTVIIDNLMDSHFSNQQDFNVLTKILFSFFECLEDDEIDAFFNMISVKFNKFERLKYSLLHAYINRTGKTEVIKNFFLNFDNPLYLFDLIITIFNVKWTRSSINLFEQSLKHFWVASPDKTEDFILSLISTKQKAGMLPLDIVMANGEFPMQIDLLKIKNEEDQKLAVSMFCIFPHSFDKLLPLLIRLIDSPFPNVVSFLQNRLSFLVFESYHEVLIEWLENIIPKSRKKTYFLKPIKKVLVSYKKVQEIKLESKDLNPYYNEKAFMDLYFGLENENRAEMMEDVKKNPHSLSKLFKSTSIIRGNSWKFEDQEKVMPLGKIQTQMFLDSRIYKNPELYEFQLEKFNT
jgi:hypothetical protein